MGVFTTDTFEVLDNNLNPVAPLYKFNGYSQDLTINFKVATNSEDINLELYIYKVIGESKTEVVNKSLYGVEDTLTHTFNPKFNIEFNSINITYEVVIVVSNGSDTETFTLEYQQRDLKLNMEDIKSEVLGSTHYFIYKSHKHTTNKNSYSTYLGDPTEPFYLKGLDNVAYESVEVLDISGNKIYDFRFNDWNLAPLPDADFEVSIGKIPFLFNVKIVDDDLIYSYPIVIDTADDTDAGNTTSTISSSVVSQFGSIVWAEEKLQKIFSSFDNPISVTNELREFVLNKIYSTVKNRNIEGLEYVIVDLAYEMVLYYLSNDTEEKELIGKRVNMLEDRLKNLETIVIEEDIPTPSLYSLKTNNYSFGL